MTERRFFRDDLDPIRLRDAQKRVITIYNIFVVNGVTASIYRKPSGATSAEQALCDFSWLMLRSGIEPRSLVAFKNLHSLKPRNLRSHLKNYPEKVRQAVAQIMQSTPGR